MFTLIAPNLSVTKKTPVSLFRALRGSDAGCSGHSGFSVYADSSELPLLSVAPIKEGDHIVTVGAEIRRISAAEVLPTAQLYLSAQRLRHRLDTADVMVIRPV